MRNNLEIIYMEGQGHIFTIDLIFLGQRVMMRGPAFSEQYFVVLGLNTMEIGSNVKFNSKLLDPEVVVQSKCWCQTPVHKVHDLCPEVVVQSKWVCQTPVHKVHDLWFFKSQHPDHDK